MTHRFVVPAWARLGTAAVMAAAVLSGCTGSEPDPGPTGATATSPTESATESPTPTEEPTETSALPPLPEEATENTPEGAEAFIRYYFDVANELYMDPPPAQEIAAIVGPDLVDPECVSCENLRQELREFSEGNYSLQGPLYEVGEMLPIGGGPPGVQRFQMRVDMLEHTIDSATGEETTREGQSLEGIGAAMWTGEKWVLYGLELG